MAKSGTRIPDITSDDELFKPDEITTKKPPSPDIVKEIKTKKDLSNTKLKKEDSQSPIKHDASTITTLTMADIKNLDENQRDPVSDATLRKQIRPKKLNQKKIIVTN